MLFLVISEPRPEPPSTVTAARQRYWTWIQPLIDSGEVRSVHAKVGRGAVVLFDVASNEALHAYLNAWADIVPARFEVHALIDPAHARRFLDTQGAAVRRRLRYRPGPRRGHLGAHGTHRTKLPRPPDRDAGQGRRLRRAPGRHQA